MRQAAKNEVKHHERCEIKKVWNHIFLRHNIPREEPKQALTTF
jgi:hypothetical protein